MKKKAINTLLLILAGWGAFAQNFTHTLQLPRVDGTGYYTIALPTALFSVCQNNHADIRLFETGNTAQVPYLLKLSTDNPEQKIPFANTLDFYVTEKTKEYTEVSLPAFANRPEGSIHFYTVLYNGEQNNIRAKINPNASYNDNWTDAEITPFADDSSLLISAFHFRAGSVAKVRLYGLKNTVSVKKVVHYGCSMDTTLFARIEGIHWQFENNGSNKTSIINGTLPYGTPIAKIIIEPDHSAYFKRTGIISLFKNKPKGVFRKAGQQSHGIELNSGEAVQVEANNYYANTFTLKINNNDDVPIQVKTITAYAPVLYLTAKLEAGKSYELKAGDPDLDAPNYDLEYNYSLQVKDTLVAIAELIPYETAPGEKRKKTLLVWGALGLCILVLGGMALSMIKKAEV